MKVTNLIGNEYKGTIGKSVTASNWKGRNYLKKWFKPTNPNTAKQQTVRGLMGTGNAIWQGFSTLPKRAYYWYQRYRKTNISPFNAFISAYITIEHAAPGTYGPPVGTVIAVTDGVPNPIAGATVIVRKTGQATDYMNGYTDIAGETGEQVGVEDQNYDLFITAPGFTFAPLLNQPNNVINATHVMV